MSDFNQLAPVMLRLRAQQRHWQALPAALSKAQEHALTADCETRTEIIKKLKLLEQGWREHVILSQTSLWLQDMMPKLHRAGAIENQLAQDLHATLEQHLYVAARDFSSDLAQFAQQGLIPSQAWHLSLDSLEQSLQQLPTFEINLTTIELPVNKAEHAAGFWILVVENEPIWQDTIHEVLLRLQNRLDAGIFEFVICYSVTSAKEALAKMPKEPWQRLVILDLGLPEDSEGSSRREHGLALVRELRDYTPNLPVVVLTTPWHMLEVQVQLQSEGIAASDYILKSGAQDPVMLLEQSLLRHIRRGLSHKLQVPVLGQVSIDGIPIALPPLAREIFGALATLSQGASGYFKPQDVLHQLHGFATGLETSLELAKQNHGHWARTPELLAAVETTMRFWRARTGESPGQLDLAWDNFRSEFPQQWQNACTLFELWNRTQNQGQTLTPENFDAVFGSPQLKLEHKPKQIYDGVHEIRKCVHQAFKQAGRYIDASRELLVQNPASGGYRLLGNIDLADRSLRPMRKFRLLVLENNPERQTHLTELLKLRPRLNVSLAGSVEQALKLVKSNHFDLLLLDLHLPLTEVQWQQSPNSGVADGGIQALREIRQYLPALKVLVPTIHADQDELRQQLALLGVPATDVIPIPVSQMGLWEGHLLLNIDRLCQEIEQDMALPGIPAWRCPKIEVFSQKQSVLELEVNGRMSVFRSKQGLLMQQLLIHAGELVSEADLIELLYQDQPPTQGLTQLLKRIYSEIRDNWVSTVPYLSSDDPALNILERVETPIRGLILHAFVSTSFSV